MVIDSSLLADALRHLAGPAMAIAEAKVDVPRCPGLYAVHLRLAVWPSPDGAVLDAVETAVLAELLPPLNVAKVSTLWRPRVRAGRRRLAEQAEAWVAGPSEVRRGNPLEGSPATGIG
jgi:hypothetical protein